MIDSFDWHRVASEARTEAERLRRDKDEMEQRLRSEIAGLEFRLLCERMVTRDDKRKLIARIHKSRGRKVIA